MGPVLAKYLFTYADEVGKGEILPFKMLINMHIAHIKSPSTADDDNEHHGLKKTIEAFNDGGVLDVPKMVEFTTQTEEVLFIMAAKGEIFDASKEEEIGADSHGDSHAAHDALEGVEGGPTDAPSVEAVAAPTDGSPRRLGGRKGSLRMITPRRRLEHGGYTFLSEGGDVELTPRGGHHTGTDTHTGGEAVNPMWGEDQHEQTTQGPFPLANVLPSWATTMFHGAEK